MTHSSLQALFLSAGALPLRRRSLRSNGLGGGTLHEAAHYIVGVAIEIECGITKHCASLIALYVMPPLFFRIELSAPLDARSFVLFALDYDEPGK
jgi:hypothetical protein